MGDGYQLLLFVSLKFLLEASVVQVSQGISGGTLKQSWPMPTISLLTFWELLNLNSTKMARSFLRHALKFCFNFKYAVYSYTDWTTGCSFLPITMLLLWDSYIFCSSVNKWMKFVGQYLRITEDGSNHSRN